jgi:hypothetical protein
MRRLILQPRVPPVLDCACASPRKPFGDPQPMIYNFSLSFHNDGVFPGVKRFVADPRSNPVKPPFSALLRCSRWDEFRDIDTFLYRRRSVYFYVLSSLAGRLTPEMTRTPTIEKSVGFLSTYGRPAGPQRLRGGILLLSPRAADDRARADPGLWLKTDQKRKHFERKRAAGRGDPRRPVK